MKVSAKKGAKVSASSLGDAVTWRCGCACRMVRHEHRDRKTIGRETRGQGRRGYCKPVELHLRWCSPLRPIHPSAEDLAKVIASGAKVVKAFNTTFAGTLLAGQVAGQPLDVFIAGDDADAKSGFSISSRWRYARH